MDSLAHLGAPGASHGLTSLAEDGVRCIAYLPNITGVLRLGLIKPTNSSSAGRRATEPLRPENAKLVVGVVRVHTEGSLRRFYRYHLNIGRSGTRYYMTQVSTITMEQQLSHSDRCELH